MKLNFFAETAAMSSPTLSIQDLVDDHAILGMDNGSIRLHLYEEHSIAPGTPIPPSTKAARAARNRLLSTGKFDRSQMKGGHSLMDEVFSEHSAAGDGVAVPVDLPPAGTPQDVMRDMGTTRGRSRWRS